jgi:hypothetical protein
MDVSVPGLLTLLILHGSAQWRERCWQMKKSPEMVITAVGGTDFPSADAAFDSIRGDLVNLLCDVIEHTTKRELFISLQSSSDIHNVSSLDMLKKAAIGLELSRGDSDADETSRLANQSASRARLSRARTLRSGKQPQTDVGASAGRPS